MIYEQQQEKLEVDFQKRNERADQRERQIEARNADLSREVTKKAKELTESELEALRGEYDKKNKALGDMYKALKTSHKFLLVFSVIYDIFVTVLTAVFSEPFAKDFVSFFKHVEKSMLELWDSCVDLWVDFVVREWHSNIGWGLLSTVFAIVMCLIIVAFILAVVVGPAVYGATQGYADKISLVFSLVTFDLIVFFADILSPALEFNLFALYLITQVIYLVIRVMAERIYFR